MKERVTLTIDHDLLVHVDQTVDGTNVKNRSHAVELLLRKALHARGLKTAVILAGGKGTRLKPLTDKIPKPLIEIQGKPILDHNIALCKAHGITNIVLSVGYMKEQIKAHYGNGNRHGVTITYVEETTPLGTAGPLRMLKDKLTDTFVLMNADELKEIDLTKMYEHHVAHGAETTIALTTVEDPSAYGVAILDGSRITGFVEKPRKDQAPSKLINAGLYLCEPSVLRVIPEGFAMMEADVFPRLAQAGSLAGYPFSGQWFDTGTHERLERARKQWRGLTA